MHQLRATRVIYELWVLATTNPTAHPKIHIHTRRVDCELRPPHVMDIYAAVGAQLAKREVGTIVSKHVECSHLRLLCGFFRLVRQL